MPVSAPPEGFEARVERALGSFALPSVAPNVVRQLVAYCDLTVTWNQRVDLTAARSPDELVDLLLADALAIAAARGSSKDERWLDVG
ncbi:MAG TPA: RsmG family class I SAM-dependent methyltransferase, partial [Polyangiaceae bacterium]